LVLQIWSYPCPQGYRYRQCGNEDRRLVDHEGLALVKIAGKEAGDTRRRRASKKRARRDTRSPGPPFDTLTAP